MQRGQRHLGGADQVEVVLGQVVDLLLGVGEEAGAEERLLADEHRRDDRREALLAEQRQRPAHERQLEQHEIALEVGEARARHLRGGLHVDQVAGELEVVATGLACLADLAQHGVLVGRVGVGRVGEGEHDRSSRRRSASVSSSPSALPCAATSCIAAIASLASSPCGLCADRSPWMPRSGARAAPRPRAAARGGCSSQLRATSSSVRDGLGAPARERGSHRVRVAPDELQVEDGGYESFGDGGLLASLPAYFATKAATFSASAPTTMFWGMIAPEKPPLRMA